MAFWVWFYENDPEMATLLTSYRSDPEKYIEKAYARARGYTDA